MQKNKKLIQIAAILAICCSFIIPGLAQETIAPAKDSLMLIIDQQQNDLKALKKFKISGYMQGQYQLAEEKGAAALSGTFTENTDQRFTIRRGRLKTAYTGKLSEAAVQLDYTVEKSVGLKEAYYKITEPLFQIFSLQCGLFNRPFGYEIEFSATAMEAPERAWVVQAALPGETDLGANFIVQLPKGSPLAGLRIDAGLYNGTNNKADYDNIKDFIGRLSYKNSAANGTIAYGAAVSMYNGGTWNYGNSYYEWKNNGFAEVACDSLATVKRKFYGADAQVGIKTAMGLTTLRIEILSGQNPGSSSSNKVPIEPTEKKSYIRNFQGGYAYFVQGILKTKASVVAKYEWFDPNTNVEGMAIGNAANRTGKADIAYTTLGLGCFYEYDSNIRFTAFYDITNNEKTSLAGYTADKKDNIFTFRIQYKF